MNIGNNISALRKAKGITQEELANELGVSAQAVSKWENNSSYPDVSLLTKIADFFGVTVDALLRSNEDEIIFHNDNENSCNDHSHIHSTENYAKNVNVKIVQQNGKENNVKIPFKFVKLGLNVAGVFGLEKETAEKISNVINNEKIGNFVEVDTENGEHITISLV